VFYWFTVQQSGCIDYVDNVQQRGDSNFLSPDTTIIIPHLKFTCSGSITNIRIRIESMNRGSDFPFIQIWRPSPPSELYSLVDKVQIQSSYLSTRLTYLEANIPLTGSRQMHFLSGDVIGFYNPPNSGYYLRDATTKSYVYYAFNEADATEFDLNAGMTSSRQLPLIKFTLGEYDDSTGMPFN